MSKDTGEYKNCPKSRERKRKMATCPEISDLVRKGRLYDEPLLALDAVTALHLRDWCCLHIGDRINPASPTADSDDIDTEVLLPVRCLFSLPCIPVKKKKYRYNAFPTRRSGLTASSYANYLANPRNTRNSNGVLFWCTARPNLHTFLRTSR